MLTNIPLKAWRVHCTNTDSEEEKNEICGCVVQIQGTGVDTGPEKWL